jgi:hypothetical protein
MNNYLKASILDALAIAHLVKMAHSYKYYQLKLFKMSRNDLLFEYLKIIHKTNNQSIEGTVFKLLFQYFS